MNQTLMIVDNSLMVRYLNIRGLTNEKLSTFISNVTFDIAFLSETWYLAYQVSPSPDIVLAESTVIARYHSTRRQDGGIYMYVKRPLLSQISSKSSGNYYVSVTIGGITIVAVYLPPSLKDSDLDNVLATLPRADIYIGDWNVRFGSVIGDTYNGPPERIQSISQFCSARNVSLRVPSVYEEPCRVDHVFSRPSLLFDVKVLLKPVDSTDHPMLGFDLSLASSFSSIDSYTRTVDRFDINSLDCVYLRQLFIQIVDQEFRVISSMDITDADYLDFLICSVLQTSLDVTVGNYDANSIQHTNDNSLQLASSISGDEAVRLFARSMRSHRVTHILQSRSATTTPAQEALDHFSRLFSISSTVSLDDLPLVSFENNAPYFELSITCSDIVKVINSYPKSKSPGMDGLDARLFKILLDCPAFVQLLSCLFSLCLDTGTTPLRWNESVIFPLVKPGKDARFIDERRPISLTAMMRRFFEKCLLSHLEPLLSFDAGQAGFRRGYSTLTHALLAAEGSQRGMKNKVFIDLSNAYDRVLLPRLWHKLQLKQLPANLLNILKSLFEGCQSWIAVNGSLVGPVERERGLFQGSVLSPILFNVYIDDLAATLNQSSQDSVVPVCLLYADDILIQHHCSQHVQNLLGLVDDWCIHNGMTVNISKCGTFAGNAFMLNGHAIPKVLSYKYLGFPHNAIGLDIPALIENLTIKTSSFIGFLYANTCSLSWPEHIKVVLFKTFVRPLMEYGAAFIFNYLEQIAANDRDSKKLWLVLEKTQYKAISWIFSRSKPKTLLRSLSGLEPIKVRFNILALFLLRHIRRMSLTNPITAVLSDTRQCVLIRHCSSHSLSQWLQLSSLDLKANIAQLKWSTFQNGILTSYVLDSSRHKSGMDYCLFIRCHALRRNAIQWRANAIGCNKKCATCKEIYTRAHISSCNLISDTDCNRALWDDYQLFLPRFILGNHYTVLDHALNRKDYVSFELLLQLLSTQLTSHV